MILDEDACTSFFSTVIFSVAPCSRNGRTWRLVRPSPHPGGASSGLRSRHRHGHENRRFFLASIPRAGFVIPR